MNRSMSVIKNLIEQLNDSEEAIGFPKSLLKNYIKIGIKPNEWSLYCLIETLQKEGKEIPHQAELAEMLDMSTRNVQVMIADLKNKGLLETKVIKRENRTIYNFKPMIDMANRYEEQLTS